MWNIALHPSVGCYNIWANLYSSGCSPPGEKIIVKWDYHFQIETNGSTPPMIINEPGWQHLYFCLIKNYKFLPQHETIFWDHCSPGVSWVWVPWVLTRAKVWVAILKQFFIMPKIHMFTRWSIITWSWIKHAKNKCAIYCQTSNISHTLVGNQNVDHSHVVGGAAPTTSS